MKDKSVEVGLPVILLISLVAGGPYFPAHCYLLGYSITSVTPLDHTMSFNNHVSTVVRACNFHLSALRHIRSLVSDTVAQQIVAASWDPGWIIVTRC